MSLKHNVRLEHPLRCFAKALNSDHYRNNFLFFLKSTDHLPTNAGSTIQYTSTSQVCPYLLLIFYFLFQHQRSAQSIQFFARTQFYKNIYISYLGWSSGPEVRTSFCFCSHLFLCSSINSTSGSTKREAVFAEDCNEQHILAITSLLSNFKPIRIK